MFIPATPATCRRWWCAAAARWLAIPATWCRTRSTSIPFGRWVTTSILWTVSPTSTASMKLPFRSCGWWFLPTTTRRRGPIWKWATRDGPWPSQWGSGPAPHLREGMSPPKGHLRDGPQCHTLSDVPHCGTRRLSDEQEEQKERQEKQAQKSAARKRLDQPGPALGRDAAASQAAEAG